MPILDMTLSRPFFSALTYFALGLRGRGIAGEHLVAAQRGDRLEREVRIHRAGAVADEQRDVARPRAARPLDDEAGAHALARRG